jgi:hypothetical protein
MVETRSFIVGRYHGDEMACLARPTRGTKTLPVGTTACRSCESMSTTVPVLVYENWHASFGFLREGF